MDRDLPESLRTRLDAHGAARLAAEQRIEAAGPTIGTGSVLVRPTPFCGALTWVVCGEERDELLLRPCDDRTLALPGDVRVDDGAGGFLVVRSLVAAHVPRRSVGLRDRVDVVAAGDRERLPPSTAVVAPEGLDDEELEWAARLVRAAEAVEALAHGRPVVLRLRDLVDPATVFGRDRDAAPSEAIPAALAAASTSAEAAFDRLGALGFQLVEELEIGHPGRVALIATERGLGILCESDRAGGAAPEVRRGAGALLWDRAPAGGAHRIWIDVDWSAERPVLWLGTAVPISIEVRGGGAFGP